MSDDKHDYHYHQYKSDELREWGENNPEEWEKDELSNNEELLAELEAEREGREQAREEHGDDADEGHDDRIEKLRDTEQTVRNRIAWCKGEYSYDDDGEQAGESEDEGDERVDGGVDEEEDMDIESESDSD